jgi:predicted TIM-barrel enzyme
MKKIMFDNKPIFAMIHLAGHPVDRAMKEIQLLQEEGVEGIIVENYHGSIRDIIDVMKELRNHTLNMKIGINILPNEFQESIHISDVYGADFVQLDFVSGNYKRTTPINELELNHMRNKYPNVKIIGGVHPKYYEPTSDLITDLNDGMVRCDAIAVTGSGTGKETPLDKIKMFRETIGDFPLIVGAGLDTSNMVEQLSIADGAIVGSCLKPYKRTQEIISRDLVQEFMEIKRTIK